MLAAIAAASARAVVCSRPTSYDLYVRLPQEYPKFYHTLRRLWGTHWVEAAITSYGEGSWHSWASNGCYKGTFQMGCSERALYGNGSDLVSQAYAAHRYYLISGWGPWRGGCAP